MKKIGILTLVLLALGVASCKKKTRQTSNSNLTLKMNTICNGTPITLGLMNKVNAAGNAYSINMLKYYISGVVITDENGNEFPFYNYDLIDISDEASSTIKIPELPFGKYTKIKLNMGVDFIRNHEGAQDGDLDPIYGMIWNWNTGYIFYKHEGQYMASDSTVQNMVLHLGTDKAYGTAELPLNWEVTESSKSLHINFDVNNMYNSPVINFNTDNNRMSTEAADIPWVVNMRDNVADAFSVDFTE